MGQMKFSFPFLLVQELNILIPSPLIGRPTFIGIFLNTPSFVATRGSGAIPLCKISRAPPPLRTKWSKLITFWRSCPLKTFLPPGSAPVRKGYVSPGRLFKNNNNNNKNRFFFFHYIWRNKAKINDFFLKINWSCSTHERKSRENYWVYFLRPTPCAHKCAAATPSVWKIMATLPCIQ